MTKKPSETQAELDQVAHRAAIELRASEEQLSTATADKLHAARMQAVAAAQAQAKAKRSRRTSYLVPGLGLGASMAGIALVAVLMLPGTQAIAPLPDLAIEGDVGLLAASSETELLDDLEFVAWMVMLDEPEEDPAG